jgi:hypothetical protein
LGQGITNLSAESSSNVVIDETFLSSNFTSTYVSHSDELAGGQWTSLQIPFANYTTVYDSTHRFFMADRFSIAVNVPAGHATTTLQLANVSLAHPAFQTYTLPTQVSLATNSFFEGIPTLAQNSTIVLTDPTGDLTGSYDTRGSPYSVITPLAEFSSEANQGFTQIIIQGQASSTPITLVTPQQSPWVPVESKWQTKQDMTIPTLPVGFRGIVWKETYTSAWSVQGTSKNGQASPQAYYLAGPGLVYIPLHGPLNEINISYHPFSPTEILIFVILAASIIPLIVFRKKIYAIGAGIPNHVQSRDKTLTDSLVPDETIANGRIQRAYVRVTNAHFAQASASAQ